VIYLVRHGQSEWNVARLTQGQTAHPRLTELGRAQVAAATRALLTDLGHTPVVQVVTSDLVRAVESAEIIAMATGAAVRTDPRLREQSLGRFEGLGYEEAFAAGSALDWSDPDQRVGGGESLREVSERMTGVLAELSADGAVVVAVSHGDAIRAALAARAGHGPGDAVWVEVPNGSVACLDDSSEVRWLPTALPVSSR
jgi:probable phosphoglycerate mutase